MGRKKATAPVSPTAPATPEPSYTVEQLRELHDNDLAKLTSKDAKAVYANRGTAANFIRIVLARTYARNDMCTFFQWSVVPCITPERTLGFLDTARGTAFDSQQLLPPECDDLGYGEPDKAYGGANNPGGETYIYEGTVDGGPLATVDNKGGKSAMIVSHVPLKVGDNLKDVTPKPPTMPPGWRQIVLPTWRGYNGDGHHTVPKEFFADPKTWIKPKLVAFGLRTCYGTRGKPRRCLTDTAGWHVDRGEHSPNNWPHGVPDWINKEFEPTDPEWWPWTDESRALAEGHCTAFYRTIAAQLAAHFDDPDGIMAGFDEGMAKGHTARPELGKLYYSPNDLFSNPTSYARWLCNRASEEGSKAVLKEQRVFRPAVVYTEDDRRHAYNYPSHYVWHLLWRLVERRLWEVGQTLMWMEPKYNDDRTKLYEETLKGTAPGIAKLYTQGFYTLAYELIEKQLVADLYGCDPSEVK